MSGELSVVLYQHHVFYGSKKKMEKRNLKGARVFRFWILITMTSEQLKNMTSLGSFYNYIVELPVTDDSFIAGQKRKVSFTTDITTFDSSTNTAYVQVSNVELDYKSPNPAEICVLDEDTIADFGVYVSEDVNSDIEETDDDDDDTDAGYGIDYVENLQERLTTWRKYGFQAVELTKS